jgi:hypothetical protein
MKKLVLWLIPALFISLASLFVFKKITLHQKEEIRKGLESEKAERKNKKALFRESRTRYLFDMLKDPATGKIPAGIFEKERALAKTLPVRSIINSAARFNTITALNNYLPAGPNNIGGRTRALSYDIRFNGTTNRVIIAGSTSSGILRTADGGNTWAKAGLEEDTHSFTVIAQDPRPGFQDTWYAAGGEPYGNTATEVGATYLGYGLWKSTNNGVSWTKLSLNNITEINGGPVASGALEAFDHPFDYVHKIVINPTNGDVYAAGHRRLLRSTNGGNSFQVVFAGILQANAGNGQMDITISNTGRIFLAVNGGIPDPNLKGIWISNTGNINSFTRIAGGKTLGVDSVANWRGNDYVNNNSRRVLLALAPSDQNVGYVFYENGLKSASPDLKPEADLFRFTVSGNTITWSNRSANMPDFPGSLEGSDPLRLQEGYNMVLSIKPNDPNTVIVGGTNLYRSSDGFASSNNTAWINGYSTSLTYQQYPNGHPDQHAVAFNPMNPSQAIVGDDGGVRFTSDISAGSVSWSPLPNYQTLQYYYVTIDPQEGKNNFAGGAQDNGVLLRDKARAMGTALADSNNHVRLLGGDGGAVGLAKQAGDQFLYGSSQGGEIRRIRLNGFSSTDIKPLDLTANDDGGFGEFITNLRLNPDNTQDLYYVNFNRLFRTATASTVNSNNWTELTGVRQAVNPSNPSGGRNISIRAIAFTRGTYTSSHSLFLGTTEGKIFRLDDPRNTPASSVPVNITPSGLAGNVQDIAVNPTNDNELLAVVSNYNVPGIWWTTNAKSSTPTWRNVEGNLSLPSVRSCQIIINTSGTTPVTEYYVGTSIGLYSTDNLNSNPVWQREGGSTLGFAVVQSMAHRPSDNVLVVGTHGNGMYYTAVGKTIADPNSGNEIFIESVAPTLVNSFINYKAGNLSTLQTISVRVFNAKGQLMFNEKRAYASSSLNFSRYAAGIYIISFTGDDGKHTFNQKIVKQ